MKKTAAVLGLILWSLLFLGGCRFIKIEEEPRKPLEYSIVKQENLPAELTALIEEKKGKEFQMTYQSEKELFLIKGYGQQMSGGYSIQVEELGATENPLCFAPNPRLHFDLKEAGVPSYPCVVIRTKAHRESVVFQ